MRTSHKLLICVLFPLLLTSIALGQQDYIGRYDVYAGYMYLNTPLLNLGETGFHTQFGLNPTKWYSMGFDFSDGTGNTSLITSMQKASVQQQINAQLGPLKAAGYLPANYEPIVPMHSHSQTYATGPQINFRHFRKVTLFIHPDLGAIHDTDTPHPTDAIGRALVAQLAPSGTKQEWTAFYGVGGGIDFNVTRYVGLKLHADFVRDHLFSDLLNWQNSVRFSIGPVFHMGPNVAAQK